MSDLKIYPSPTYGPITFRKMVSMSVFTFDAEDDLQSNAWSRAHPKHEFSCFSVKHEATGIFSVWLPMLRDNTHWQKPTHWQKEYHKRRPYNAKNLSLPVAVKDKDFILWYENVKSFCDWENALITEIRNELESIKV